MKFPLRYMYEVGSLHPVIVDADNNVLSLAYNHDALDALVAAANAGAAMAEKLKAKIDGCCGQGAGAGFCESFGCGSLVDVLHAGGIKAGNEHLSDDEKKAYLAKRLADALEAP